MMSPDANEFTGIKPMLDPSERAVLSDNVAVELELMDASSEFWLDQLAAEERLKVQTAGGTFTFFRPDPTEHLGRVEILESGVEDLAVGERVIIEGASLGMMIANNRIKQFCRIRYMKIREHQFTEEELVFLRSKDLLSFGLHDGLITERDGAYYIKSWDRINRWTAVVEQLFRQKDDAEPEPVFQ